MITLLYVNKTDQKIFVLMLCLFLVDYLMLASHQNYTVKSCSLTRILHIFLFNSHFLSLISPISFGEVDPFASNSFCNKVGME
jgi:hypothetical protein